MRAESVPAGTAVSRNIVSGEALHHVAERRACRYYWMTTRGCGIGPSASVYFIIGDIAHRGGGRCAPRRSQLGRGWRRRCLDLPCSLAARSVAEERCCSQGSAVDQGHKKGQRLRFQQQRLISSARLGVLKARLARANPGPR